MGKHKHIFQRFLLISGLALFVVCTAGIVHAQNVTQGYKSDQSLQQGMIVRTTPKDDRKVEALTQKDVDDMLGIVVSPADASVALSDPTADDQVYVAVSGPYSVLVSTQNGPIKQGDYITISSLGGVGMKAENSQQLVIGKALGSFDGATPETKATLTTNKGKKEVGLGHVKVEVSVAHNPLYQKEEDIGVPRVLSKAAELVTNRPVSAFRIYASLGVFALSLLVAGCILYVGIRSGMTSIGRNPLARKTIFRSLIQVTLMSLIVFVIGVFAVYLLLRI
jgi:hypothetical protein